MQMTKEGRRWTEERRKAHSEAMKQYHKRRKIKAAPKQEASWWQRLLAMLLGVQKNER